MKKIAIIFSICALTGVLMPGCSKPKTPAAQNESKTDASTAASASTAPADLRIKWTTGKKYTMRMELKQNTETRIPSLPQPAKQDLNLTQNFTFSVLKKLDSGGWELELEFESEMLDVMQGDKTVLSFDSTAGTDSDTNNPAAAILRAMIGSRIQYFTDADGKVERIAGVDELKSRLSAVAKPQQIATFNQMFNEETLKQYGSFADELPNRMVNIGDSWSLQRDIASSIGTLGLDMKYTFQNWEQHGDQQCAHVLQTGDITSKSISAATVGAAVEVKKGKVSGDFWFDPDLGMITDAYNIEDMTLKITTRTQSFEQDLKRNIRLKVLDVE